jgi:GDP-L-fucose synthase
MPASAFVAGHAGMVGAALVRRASERSRVPFSQSTACDLTRQADTEQWIGTAKPDVLILAAAKVGGIAFNDSYPVDFLADNLAIALNVIRAAYAAGVKKLLFLGSSCIYPKLGKLQNQANCLSSSKNGFVLVRPEARVTSGGGSQRVVD